MGAQPTDEFKEYLRVLLPQIGVKKVSEDDAQVIHKHLVETIRRIERARGGFVHEWVTLKSKGRIVIPDNLRNALGAVEGTRFDAHLFPSIEKPRGIVLIKER